MDERKHKSQRSSATQESDAVAGSSQISADVDLLKVPYFGGCPVCGGSDWNFQVNAAGGYPAEQHIYCCSKHRTFWAALGEKVPNHIDKCLANYKLVEPTPSLRHCLEQDLAFLMNGYNASLDDFLSALNTVVSRHYDVCDDPIPFGWYAETKAQKFCLTAHR